MKQRIITTVILWVTIALALVIFGAHAGVLLIAALAALTQNELYALFEKMGLTPRRKIGIAAGLVVIIGTYYLPTKGAGPRADSGYDLFILCFIVLTMIIIVLDMRAERLRSFIPTLFGFIYVPFLLHFLVKVVKAAELSGETTAAGLFLAVWIVATSKCTDVGALLVGLRYGRTPLSKEISPNKTIEGAVGGIAVSMLVGIVMYLFFQNIAPDGFRWWMALIFPIPIAIATIASDLVESAFNRQAGVKASGTSIPGIGGAFDLSDSLLLSAPLAFILLSNSVF